MMNTLSTEKAYTKRRRRSNRFRPPESQSRTPRPERKTAWVVAISEDGTEHCLTSKDNWTRQPYLQQDISGRPMRVVKEFEAGSYEEARNIYEAQL
jgi:hypothetical protein